MKPFFVIHDPIGDDILRVLSDRCPSATAVKIFEIIKESRAGFEEIEFPSLELKNVEDTLYTLICSGLVKKLSHTRQERFALTEDGYYQALSMQNLLSRIVLYRLFLGDPSLINQTKKVMDNVKSDS